MSLGETYALRRVGRRQFIEMCAGTLALAAVGCGRRQRAASNRSTVTVLCPIDERGLGPAWDQPTQYLVFLPLVTQNAQGEPEGRLAESWEHSKDFRTWTVHLRKGVRWHDGVPVTAHDIKFTLDLLSISDLHWFAPDAISTRVLDDNTCLVTHTTPSSEPIVLDCYQFYFPKHLLERLDPKKYYEWDFWTHPVGNGPYRYVRHVPKTMIELEANPDYYRGKPKIERVVLKFGDPSASGALNELVNGNVDAIDHVNRMDLLKLAANPRFRVYDAVDSWNPKGMAWNQHCPLFRESKIRRALTLAINRPELLQVLNLPETIPVFDAPFTQRQLGRGELPKPVPHDPELANRFLEEAGWENSGGIRRRGGKPFEFTTLVPRTEQLDKAALYVQAQLRRVGIQMNIASLEQEAEKQRLKAGDFEAALGVMNSSISDTFGLAGYFGERSLIGYSNPQLIALLHKAQASMDPDDRERAFCEFRPILQADLPITFLYPNVWTTVAHERVRGLSNPEHCSEGLVVQNMYDLWLAEKS